MGLAFLPWEKWLPPYILGPLMFFGGIFAFAFLHEPSWWQYLLMPITTGFGAWGTWVWFTTGKNIFHTEDKTETNVTDGKDVL
jgi:protein-S-isoprenylcysteine O-methyltransferase Ste14